MAIQQACIVLERKPTGYPILVVENDTSIGVFLHLAITQETPYLACVVATSQQALAVVQQLKPRLFLLDYRLHSTTGLALYDQLHAIAGLESVPAIITTTDFERHHQKIEERQLLCLSKPFDFDVLLTTIEYMLS